MYDFGRLHANFCESAAVARLCESMWEAAQSNTRPSRLALDGALLMLLSELMQLAERGHSPGQGGLASWQLRWVLEHMSANIGNDVTLAELASPVGVSPNHFCTAFRASTGEPPHRYFVRLRLDRAKQLLRKHQSTVTEVAHELGFASSAHFSSVFRKHVGAPPSQWRREHISAASVQAYLK